MHWTNLLRCYGVCARPIVSESAERPCSGIAIHFSICIFIHLYRCIWCTRPIVIRCYGVCARPIVSESAERACRLHSLAVPTLPLAVSHWHLAASSTYPPTLPLALLSPPPTSQPDLSIHQTVLWLRKRGNHSSWRERNDVSVSNVFHLV